MICKKCGAEVSQEDLDYAEDHEMFPPELEHQVDCGCSEHDEGYGADVCKCKFEKAKVSGADKTENSKEVKDGKD